MPKATKLSPVQVRILRNIRDYGFHAALGFHGMSERGGAYQSVMAMRRRGYVEGPHRAEHLTEEGKQVLQQIEDDAARARNVWTTRRVRKALLDAGVTEAGSWGFLAEPGTVDGVVHVSYVRGTNFTAKESSVRYGNDQISEYVRVLNKAGFKASRVKGMTKVDNLLVTIAKRNN